MTEPDPDGRAHLVWIGRFQVVLAGLGTALWLLRSPRAALVFLAGSAVSVAFWYLHSIMISRMLTPSVKRRWLYAFLSVAKLALIAFGLRAMMASFSTEAVPLATGILLFVGGILLEAARLAVGGGD